MINNYNKNMRKLLLLFITLTLTLTLTLPSYAKFYKKDKALELELEGKGYAGTLPDLSKKEQKPQRKTATPIFESQNGFNDPSDLKPVPDDNPAFVNIIQKKNAPSQYSLDANEIIPYIEKLVDCIEEEGPLQLFISRAYSLTMNIDHIIEKYQGKSESDYDSYKNLSELNQYVKSVSLLRQEAVTYQRYLAYQTSGSIYNPENISQQLEYLKDELNATVIILKKQN